MVRIAVEVADGAARYEVAVQAESIGCALKIAEGLGLGSDIKVKFPLDPETFFVKDPVAKAGLVEQEELRCRSTSKLCSQEQKPQRMAA